MTAENRRLFLALLGIALALLGLGIYKVTRTLGALEPGAIVSAPVIGLGLAAGLLVGFKAGQYHRGWMHARGIRKSHWKAIRGEHR